MTNSSDSPNSTKNPALLVAGPSGAERARLAAALSQAFDRPTRELEHGSLLKSLKPAGSIALIALLPDPQWPDPTAQLLSVVREIRALEPSLPVLIAGDLLSPRQVAALYDGSAVKLLFEAQLDDEARMLVARRLSRAAGTLFDQAAGAPRVIGSAPTMLELARLVERVATSDATVLILGESGTGKELIARAVHALSPRRKGPFVAINCAAIPETLLENELFGHEKGAYTGASSTAIGKVEAAERGTLFLDEIGEMPLQLQSKILRLLQDHTYDRIGGTKTRKADVRIVTATNRELKEEVAGKRFREDLYYRLSVVPVLLPALRDRRGDIALIAQSIVDRLAERLGRPHLRLTPEAMERMVSYRWPGNVREMENELERAAVLAHGDEIGPSDLELRSRVEDPDRLAWARLVPLDGPLEVTTTAAARASARLRISIALEESAGDREAAARSLGISRDELERQLA